LTDQHLEDACGEGEGYCSSSDREDICSHPDVTTCNGEITLQAIVMMKKSLQGAPS
jgi:hypothetical protein